MDSSSFETPSGAAAGAAAGVPRGHMQRDRGAIESKRASERGPLLPGMPADSDARVAGAQRTERGGRSSSSPRSRALLFGSPREVLARISAGDPLEMRPRVAAHLMQQHLLLDADRLHLRALAHCARRALQLRAADGLEPFLRGRVADAARELIREDREAARNGQTRATGMAELARPLGLDAARAHLACSRFNEIEAADRKACFQLLVEGADIDSIARSESTTVTDIARRARRALEIALEALGSSSISPRRRSGGMDKPI